MTAHASAEELSAYLDDELRAAEARDLEHHLEDCTECTTRLAGLRRVVSHLRSAERRSPPSTLDQLVAKRIAFEADRRSPLDVIEDGLSVVNRQSPMLAMFAVVIALCVMLLLLSIAIDRARSSFLPVVFSELPELVDGQTVEVAGRTLEWSDGRWIEQGIEVAELEKIVASVSLSSPEGMAVIEKSPELNELVGRLDGSAIIRVEDRILEVTE